MTDLTQALAELRRDGPIDEPWTASLVADGNPYPSSLAGAVATILNAVLSGELLPRETALAMVAAVVEKATDGSRPLPFDRDTAGRMVREAWVRWALTQPNPKTSWLVPYDGLGEVDKEADRQIGEALARWTLIHDAAALTPADAPAALDAAISRAREVKP